MSTTQSDYLTSAEAAQALNVTQRTVQRLIRSGKLPVSKRGARGVALVSYADVAILMSTQKAAASDIRDIARVLAQRVHVLEHRLAQVESLLEMTPTQLVTTFDVDTVALREALLKINQQRRWGVTEITNVLGDLSRIAEDVVRAVGPDLVVTTLRRAIVEARLLRHSRSELYAGRAKLVLLRIHEMDGVVEAHPVLDL